MSKRWHSILEDIFITILNFLVIIIFLNEYYIERKNDSKYDINLKLNYFTFYNLLQKKETIITFII